MDNYQMWETTPLTPAVFQSLSRREQALYLCRLASLAPSSHNTQPWRFLIEEKSFSIEIYLDRTYVLAASDVAGRQTVISIGCAIENLVTAAESLGITAKVEVLLRAGKDNVLPFGRKKDGSPRYVRTALIHCTTSGKPSLLDKSYAAIFTRKVMRVEFDANHPIPTNVTSALLRACEGKTTKLHLISDPLRRMGIAEFQHQADGFVINSISFSHELGAWLLPNDTPSPLGMPGAGFGLKDAEAIRMHQGLLGERPLEPEDGLKFALAGKMGIEKSPLICCITIQKDEPAQWIEAGCAFERMFLLLESRGIAVSVHAGIVEVPLVTRIFGASLGTLRRPVVLFRAGYVKDPANKRPHSPRLPLKDIILDKKPDR